MMNLFLLGGSGHCKVISDIARRCGHEIIGVVELREELIGQQAEPGGARITWGQAAFLKHVETHGQLPEDADAVIISIGYNAIRMRCIDMLSGFQAPALVDPSAIISPGSTIGAGSVVMPNVVVNASSTIGRGVILNTGSIVEHDCLIGDGVHISPNATLCGGVTVGEQSWVAAGAVVIPGVTIGAHVTVGAGTVVIQDLPDGVTAVGSPARIIKTGAHE